MSENKLKVRTQSSFRRAVFPFSCCIFESYGSSFVNFWTDSILPEAFKGMARSWDHFVFQKFGVQTPLSQHTRNQWAISYHLNYVKYIKMYVYVWTNLNMNLRKNVKNMIKMSIHVDRKNLILTHYYYKNVLPRYPIMYCHINKNSTITTLKAL